MKRMLCIMNKMGTGGAEAFLMKIYRNINREKYQFDYCIYDASDGFYADEIKGLGGQIFHIPKKSESLIGSMYDLYKLIKQGNYEYVYRSGQDAITMLDLVVAKMAGAKRTIYRSINSSLEGQRKIVKILHRLLFPLCVIIPDVKIAPSDLAAEFMFGKKAVENNKVLILNNGIPLESYIYSGKTRAKIRKSLGINEDELVIGHVGRFSEQKNHVFLLNVFSEILKKNGNSHLLLVGEGELEDKIHDIVIKAGISEKVSFLGVRRDVPDLLSAMDIFILPSFFEGMPNVVIEAQANGLPCIISDTITSTAQITENVKMLPLSTAIKKWVDVALYESERMPCQESQKQLKDAGYSISDVVERFEQAVFEA